MRKSHSVFCLFCLLAVAGHFVLWKSSSALADDETPAASIDIADIYRRVIPAIVSIEVDIGWSDEAGGTGFVIDDEGHIVTNAHVVEDARRIRVFFHDGWQNSAELVGYDPFEDIAVIKVDVASHGLEPINFGDSDDLAIGQSVLAIGNPHGLVGSLTRGIISGLRRELEFGDGSIMSGMIQTDAAINPGNSGGPLINLAGEVVGVNSAGYRSANNLGFAIPSNRVKRISKDMIAGQHFHIILTALPTWTPRPTVTDSPVTITPRPSIETNCSTADGGASAYIPIVGASAYQYDVCFGQPFNYQGLTFQGGVALFSPNPAAPDSYLRTDMAGMLWYRPIGAASEGAMTYSPFHEGFGVASSEQNKNRVVEIDWSADGAQFTFRIDTPPGQDTVNAGVWFWQSSRETPTDPTYAVIRDCVTDGYLTCPLVRRSNAQFWKTIDVAWSPIRGSSDMLLTLELPAENRQALALVQARRDANYAQNAPEFIRYDYGHWNSDGSGIVVSGRRADGRVIIGEVNSDLRGERLIFDASAVGLWLQDAVRRPNGQIVALGRSGGPQDNAPLSLYNSAGTRLSGPIGAAAPESVSWYADRSAVVLKVQGRQYTVNVDGGLITDSTVLTRNPSFGPANIGDVATPAAVIQNSEYYLGQQLRAEQDLDLREGSSTSNAIFDELVAGDYLASLPDHTTT